MMTPPSEQTDLQVVVDWFSRQKASKIPKELEEPLRNYLSRLPAVERKRVISKQRRERSNAKATQDSLKSFEREALEYLRARQDKRGGTQIEDSRIIRTVNALASTHDSDLTGREFWTLLVDGSKSQAVSIIANNNNYRCLISAPTPGEAGHPFQRLLTLYRKVELSTHLHTLAARMLKVLIHYQYKLSGASGIDSDARRSQMLDHTGFTVEDTKDLRSRATGWLRFMSVFGVGALAMAQAQADDEFEKNVAQDFLLDCRDFFREKHPTVWQRMTAMDKTVGNLFLQLNSKYARDEVPLTKGSEVLSMCLRKAFAQPESVTLSASPECDTRAERHTTSSLSALATVAVATDERSYPMPVPHHYSQEVQDGQVETPSIDRSGLSLAIARNEETTTGQVLGPVSQQETSVPATVYEQSIHPPLRSYTEQNCQTSTHDVRTNGNQGLPPVGYVQEETTIGCRMLPSASERTTSDLAGTNVNGQGLQQWTGPEPAEMTSGYKPSGWTRNANGSLNFAGHEGWFDLVNFGG